MTTSDRILPCASCCAENDYLREVASLLALPESALDGLVADIEIEEVKESFEAVRKGPPPLPR